jgi:hypothetical protein
MFAFRVVLESSQSDRSSQALAISMLPFCLFGMDQVRGFFEMVVN